MYVSKKLSGLSVTRLNLPELLQIDKLTMYSDDRYGLVSLGHHKQKVL